MMTFNDIRKVITHRLLEVYFFFLLGSTYIMFKTTQIYSHQLQQYVLIWAECVSNYLLSVTDSIGKRGIIRPLQMIRLITQKIISCSLILSLNLINGFEEKQ